MSFTVFPHLPTELRLHIWVLYFESPRIHVLHDAKDADADPEQILLTCTTIDAETGTPVSPCFRTDINHEARRVALGLKRPRERVRTLAEPVDYSAVHGLRWRRASGRGQPQPVDVDWANDLIYVCSPKSSYPFMSLAQRPWANKVQRLAGAQPWHTLGSPAGDRQRDFQFDSQLLYHAVRVMPALKEIAVVLVPPLEADGGSEPQRAVSSEGSEVANGSKRTAFGFIEFAEYMRQPRAGPIRGDSVDVARASLALINQLGNLGMHSGVAVRKLVDVDCCRLQDGEYRRRQRNVP